MCKCTCSVWVHGKDLTWRSRRANWNLHPDLKTCISSFQNQPPYKHLTCIHAQLTAALKNFFFFKKAHSDVNHRKMGRDQKKNDILFVFLYFRETASLTSSLNGRPKQLPITAGSFTCPNSCYTGVEWEHHAISVFSYREWHCSFYRIISLYY